MKRSEKGSESIPKGPSKKLSLKSKIPLEDTIRKVLHSELRLIFPDHFFKDSGPIASKQIVLIQEKIASQDDTPLASKDSTSDESSLAPSGHFEETEEESLDEAMEIDFVQRKEPTTSVATVECKIK